MKFGFYSCMSGMPWGGSEVLWYLVARRMQRQGHEVTVNFKHWPYTATQLEEIQKQGGKVSFRDKPLTGMKARMEGFNRMIKRPASLENDEWFERERPDAVLFTLGYHPDPIEPADRCFEAGIPYAINLQCASSFFFIPSHRLELYRRWYRNAAKVFFVSQENQDKLESNLAMRLENAEIIANPFAMDYDADPEFPSTDLGFKLAVVGRIHFQSKGQDIIVDVMSKDHWRKRNLEINFYGHDQGNMKQLEDLIAMHGLEDKMHLQGYKQDVQDIWRENHGLLLPSRYEGAPLIVTETMLCNRFAVTTNLGRNAELMDDNVSGFIAESATINLVDEAMERAWKKRGQWQQIGQAAGKHIRERYPKDPVKDFSDLLLQLKAD